MERNLKYYTAARFVNLLGTGIYSICVPLFLIEQFQTIFSTSIFYTLIQIPSLLFLPLLGIFLENKNLKHVLLESNVLSAVLFLFLIGYMLFAKHQIWLFILFSALEKINSSCFNVASNSIFARIFAVETIEKANGWKSTVDNLTSVLASVFGTFIYAGFGLNIVILLNAFSFLISFLFLTKISYPETISAKRTRLSLSDGLRYITKNQELKTLFIAFMLLNFLVMPTANVFAPGILKIDYHFSDVLYGLTSTAVCLGAILSSLAISLHPKREKITVFFYMQGALMIVSGVLAYGLHATPGLFYWLYLMLCGLSGYFSTKVNIPLMAYFQKQVPAHQQTRFFSLLTLSANLMSPCGTLYAGTLCNQIGSSLAYAGNGLLLVLVLHFLFRKSSLKNNALF